VADEELAEMRSQMASRSVNPMDLKKRLAADVVTQFHGADAAKEATSHFERTVQRGEMPEDVPDCPVSFTALMKRGDEQSGRVSAIDVLVAMGLAGSRGEARRLLAQGAVEVDRRRVIDEIIGLGENVVVKVGKRRWGRIVNADRR
jgi:tyrosyl-tRNA synthetase